MTSDVETGKTTDTAVGDGESTESLDLQVQVTEPSACQRHVVVTVTEADVEKYFAQEFDKMMPEAQVPGFRAGRAPRKLVERHFRKEITDQIKGKLLLDCMTQVSEDQDFSAISEPDFDYEAIEIPDEGPFTFEFDIEVRPEFELPKWQGLQLDRPTISMDKAAIDGHLEKILQDTAVLEPVEEVAQAGDFVVLKIDFSQAGKAISSVDEVTARVLPELSLQDGVLAGFDKLMTGCKSGDKKTAEITVSGEAENEELRGEKVDVAFEVLDVKRMRLPEIDEDLLGRLGGFESEGDLRDAVKGELERQQSYRQNQRIREQITSLLTDSANWDLPPELLKRQSEREMERAIMELRSSGFSDDQIRTYTNTLRQNSLKSTESALKEHFILERIAEENDIEASDDDYDHEIMRMAMMGRESVRSVRSRIEKRGLWDVLRNQIVERKVIGLITEKATFKDVALKVDEERVSAIDVAIGGMSADIPDAKHGGDQRELQQPADRT